MNRYLYLCIIYVFFACQKQSTAPPQLPSAPVLWSSPADTSTQERGIDAIPERNALQIEWHTDYLYDGYALYRRSGNETRFLLVWKFGREDSSFIDDTVLLNVRYDYYLRAQNEFGTWSPPSDTVSYMLIEKVTDLFFSPQDNSFRWQQQLIPPRGFLLKLYNNQTKKLIWMRQVAPLYQYSEQAVTFNDDGKALEPTLSSGMEYYWRIDSVGPTTHSGSESSWSSFIMP
jgi:hypothetical protein